MGLMIKFGHLVRQERIKKGMTQNELSTLVFDKPNRTKITGIESGYTKGITFNTADKIFNALDLNVEFTITPLEE